MPKKEDRDPVVGRAHIKDWTEKITSRGNQTKGDNHNCPCPYCGKNNTHIVDGIMVERHGLTTFERPCEHCHKTIFYQAKFTISVIAKATEVSAKKHS